MLSPRDIVKVVLALLALGSVQCDGGEGTPYCDGVALQAALEAAPAGATVRVGACRITGSFTVPSGVRLVGEGPDASILVAAAPSPALRIGPGTPASRVTDLAVESGANSGIFVVAGPGEVVLERVGVAAIRGMAVAAQDVGSLTMTDVTLIGPVRPENERGWPDDPTVAATHGLVLVRVGNASLTNVTVTGFALFGALLVDSTTTWTGGGAPRNVGTGLMVYRGTATLEGLDVTGTMDADRSMNAYGALFAGDDTTEAQVASSGLRVSDGDDYGMLQQHAIGVHTDLAASGNGAAGVWVQHCSSFELSGSGTSIAGNAFAGVVGMDTARMVLQDARIETTLKLEHTVSEGDYEPVGDGIHAVSSGGTLEVRNVTLAGNERVGMLLELRGGTTDSVTVEGVTVSGVGEEFGVVAQGGTVVGGWDTGVSRDDVTRRNDETPPAALGTMPLVDPGEMPAAADVAGSGLIEIIDPDPPH